MTSFPVRMAKSFFLLKTLLIVTDSLISLAVSSAFVEGVVSVVGEFLVPGVLVAFFE